MIMEEWKEYSLGQLIELKNGVAFKSSEFVNEGIPVIKIKNVKPNRILLDDLSYVSIETSKNKKCFFLLPTDILITMTGNRKDGGPDSWVGKVALFNQEGQYLLNQRVSAIRVKNNNIVDYKYLAYLLSGWDAQLYFVNHSNSSGGQANISPDVVYSYLVILPTLSVQRRIASILSSLDDKIEVNRRINENLEAQAQALFKSWFVDFEPFRDGEFVESELGMIPKGWRVGCLDELCSCISRGLTPKYDESSDELILGQTCVRNNIVTLNNARKHKPKVKNEKWVQQWDVLLNSTGIGSLGRVGIAYFQKDNVAIDSHITVVRPSIPLYRHYIGRNLLSRQLEIENMAVGSTGQTELPRDRVKSLLIIIPSDETMDNFNHLIEPIAISMYRNINESRRLATLRDTLLPRLMSGELKVNEVGL